MFLLIEINKAVARRRWHGSGGYWSIIARCEACGRAADYKGGMKTIFREKIMGKLLDNLGKWESAIYGSGRQAKASKAR